MSIQSLFVSSGDLVADQRYRWALDYARRGDQAAAADILEQVVESVPGFATAWFALAVIREETGDPNAAVEAFEAAVAADPQDYHGARLHLARLGAGDATPDMTATYVRRLFDQHAPDFDKLLVGTLRYDGPEAVMAALEAVRGPSPRFDVALDLGCGTGLMGLALRPLCRLLAGQDISTGMLGKAQVRGVYDRIEAGDLLAFLKAEPRAAADLITAADVFIYFNDLGPVMRAAATALKPGGLFAFTTETHDGSGVVMQRTLRYAHGDDHVREALSYGGLVLRHLESRPTRTERGVPVPGFVVVAERAAGNPSEAV